MKKILLFIFCVCFAAAIDRDFYEIMSSDAEMRMDYSALADYRKEIYESDKTNANFKLWIEALLRSERYDEAILETTRILNRGDSREVRRYRVLAFYGKREFERAIRDAKIIAQGSKSSEDYILLGDLYIFNGAPKEAIASYNRSYAISPNEMAVDKIAETIVTNNGRTKEAIAYYETHLTQYGCSNYLCSRLAALYAKENNAAGLIRTYKRIYDKSKDEAIGSRIVELYIMVKDYKSLTKWLESTGFDDEFLLRIYIRDSKLNKASNLAKKLYKKTGKIDFLAQSAMLEYESVKKPNDALIKKTIDALEKVVESDRNHAYLNYLGYLLIDHDLNAVRGIELVKTALKMEPNNPYYIDSLAWGYYRIGKFKEAYNTINKLKQKDRAEPTTKSHYNAIKKAMQNQEQRRASGTR